MKNAAFKNTDIGPIPEDWEVKKLGEVCDTASGGTPSRSNPDYYNGETKWFTTTELQDCNLYDSNEHISNDALKNSSAKVFPSGTLLMAMYGATIGKLGILRTAAATNQACCAIFCGSQVDSCYAYYHLYHSRNSIIEKGCGAGQPNISQEIVRSLLLPLPPLSEQRRIAAALSDADELVASLDKLIEKKKRVKEGAMQRLLSGETRLPGFTGKWVEKKLGECGPFRKGHGITREESHSGSIPAIRYGELYTTHHDIIREYPSRISKDVAKQAVLLKKGDILFACSGETKEEIGKSAAFVDTCEAYAGGDLLILSPGSNFDSSFLGYALNRSSCVSQKAAAGQGDAVVHIREESLKEVTVFLPPTLAEQRAIATMLSDMDAEIAALSRERAEAERIKQGMMQELLTGKTRLKGE